ncbi:MAG TPA: alpha-L-fucosidase [Candidatus Dormibacteraeota bacterium]|nr:alpha-L-fucosidase [Candidatus Dormibacteraeota bacterium]
MKIFFPLKTGCLLGVLCLTLPICSKAADRMAWFNDARFGMFIHWGIYAVPAGEWDGKQNYAEWFQLQTAMPNAQYEKFAAQFNPTNFNAREWVRVAKAAGMKYMVITAKHHDGFCMYDSKLTDYNIVKATPYGRDPMKELAHEARRAGLKFCFYYSVPDWHNPDFPQKYSQRGFHGGPNPDADLEKYVAYLKGQVSELLTNYGPVSIIWFDGGGSFKDVPDKRAALIHAQEVIDLIHKLQPDCLVNNRLGVPADYGTPEQKIPGARPTNSFEVCMTLNKHWGYNKHDHDWKQPKEVMHNLVDIASKGGNYLLNVGPTADGRFPAEAVRILEDLGGWLNRNGDSIYGTTGSPLDTAPAWGRLTQKGHKVFLHVFNWPGDGKLSLEGLKPKVQRAYLLDHPSKKQLAVTQDGGKLTVAIPQVAPDDEDTVIVLDTAG